MRILLTGATGFVGKTILSQLKRLDHQTLCLSRSELIIDECSFVQTHVMDLSENETYQLIVKEFDPEVVVHLAWQDIPDFSFSKSLVNLKNSLEFLNTVMEASSCQKILVAGSCFELDKFQGECFEYELGKVKDHFTWAKHSLRSWLDMETDRRGISLGWMRIFYVYGPNQRIESLLPTFLTNLRNKQLPKIKTPHNANDFVYVEDVADGFIRAIDSEFSSGVFHFGSGYSTPVWQLCKIAEQIVCGTTCLTEEMLENNYKPTQSKIDFWANCEGSHHVLGWSPQTSLEEGIQKTWKWMKAT